VGELVLLEKMNALGNEPPRKLWIRRLRACAGERKQDHDREMRAGGGH